MSDVAIIAAWGSLVGSVKLGDITESQLVEVFNKFMMNKFNGLPVDQQLRFMVDISLFDEISEFLGTNFPDIANDILDEDVSTDD